MSLSIGIGIILIISGIITKYNENKGIDCIEAHSPDGKNYEWLEKKFGKVLEIKYEEPVENKYYIDNKPMYKNGRMIGNWKKYTEKIWKIHCKVINHKDSLIKSHYDSFIDSKKRFARLCFTFNKDGKIYDIEPTIEFYELEDKYFKKYVNC